MHQLFKLHSMQAIKFEEHFSRCLRKFAKKEGRINFELRELNELTKTYGLVKPLSQLVHSILSTSIAFKVLILINRLLIEDCLSEAQVLQLLSKLRVSSSSEFQKLLNVKLILPYKLYLQRRACIHIRKQKYTNRKQAETRVFQLLNLLNTGTAFSEVIYTFGRYYLEKYSYAIDFNIVLGADLQLVYSNMVDQVIRPASKSILEEIQMVHEKMYVIFYNCYFHKYLRSYLPKWVITDVQLSNRDVKQTARTNADTKLSRHTSMDKSCRSFVSKKKFNLSSNNLADSILLLNERVQEQVQCDQLDGPNPETPPLAVEQDQRLKLLLSMERVVAELNK